MQATGFFALQGLSGNQITHIDHIAQFTDILGGLYAFEEVFGLFKRVKATKDICELRNMINVGYLITRQALERKESRGLHYTIDYPKSPDTNTNEVW